MAQSTGGTRRRRNTRKRTDYKAVAGYSLSVILAALITYFALVSPTFYVKRTLVTGVKTLPESSIVAVVDMSKTQNIFLVPKRRIVARLLRNPVLRSAVIYRRLPDTVSVRVTERTTDMTLQSKGVLYDVDRDGIPFRVVHQPDPGRPMVKCDVQAKIVLGRKIADDSFSDARSALSLARSHRELNVVSLTVDPGSELCLNIGDGFPVRLGRAVQLPQKVEIAANMVKQIPDLLDHGEYADVSCPEAPAYKMKE